MIDMASPATAAAPPANGHAWTERPLVWGRPGERSVGILAEPAPGVVASGVAVLVVVGGPQTRVGAHRQFVQLARRLAGSGHAVLRFDLPGRGDSEGRFAGFEAVTPSVLAARAELLRALPTIQATVLWGLCDGASAALLAAEACQRNGQAHAFAGLVLSNPWVRSPQTEAAAQVKHHYTTRLRDPMFWRRVARGEVGFGAVRDAVRALWRMAGGRGRGSAAPANPSFQERMARGWLGHPGELLLIQSGEDTTAREFDEALAGQRAWRGASTHPRLTRIDIAGADHTFSHAGHRLQAEQAMLDWLGALSGAERTS
jgi:exosortase A-associated hydrolase 1